MTLPQERHAESKELNNNRSAMAPQGISTTLMVRGENSFVHQYRV
jgi:hypothetical protein